MQSEPEAPDGSPLGSVHGLVGLLGALAIGTTVSATIGSLSLRLGDVVSGGAIPTVWRTWWFGDFSGALILVPLAIAWYPPTLPAWFSRRALEGALLLAVVLGLGELGLHGHWPLVPLIFPALIWATVAFGTLRPYWIATPPCSRLCTTTSWGRAKP